MAVRIYREIVERVIMIEEIEYDVLLEIALATGCRTIDAYYIATADIVDAILITADRIMALNARKYGVEAYYIHEPNEYNRLMSRIS